MSSFWSHNAVTLKMLYQVFYFFVPGFLLTRLVQEARSKITAHSKITGFQTISHSISSQLILGRFPTVGNHIALEVTDAREGQV